MTDQQYRCGFVALVGRPNVGKSTLLNRLLGQKISITSRRPQTTRHRILGIKTEDQAQAVFVDTPGLHARQPRAMNRYLNRAASDSLRDVDVVLFVVEGTRWNEDDDWVLEKLQQVSCPVILVINKTDRVEDKADAVAVAAAARGQTRFCRADPGVAPAAATISMRSRPRCASACRNRRRCSPKTR